MSRGKHSEDLADYLQKHKNPKENRNIDTDQRRFGKGGSGANPGHDVRQPAAKEHVTAYGGKTQTRRLSSLRTQIKGARVTHYKGANPTLNDFPDEILLKIFEYLSPGELLMSAGVCRQWQNLTSDNCLWSKIYKQYVQRKKGDKDIKPLQVPSHQHPTYWKNRCISASCASNINQAKKLQRKKMSRFSGLAEGTEKALKQAGTKWSLVMCDKRGGELVTLQHSDITFFTMSASVRWCEIPSLPLHQIKRLHIYAVNPIFFNQNGKPVPNCPCRRSLLYETDFSWHQVKSSTEPLTSDDGDLLELFSPHSSPLFIASWKDGGELAFFTVAFHDYYFAERCLLGSGSLQYKIEVAGPLMDDVDTKLGLHSYNCALELRNHKSSLWKEQFLNLHCRDGGLGGGYATLKLINPDRSYERSSLSGAVETLWKTAALKGRIRNVAFLDVTLLAEGRIPIWTNSVPVKVTMATNTKVDYEYEGMSLVLQHIEPDGKVVMNLIKEEDKYYIPSLQLHISTNLINRCFGTRY